MLKKLAVPFLTLTIAAFGCSSSTTPTPGTGGGAGTSAAGGKGGATGAAGSGAAGSGAAGSGAAGSGAAGSGAAGAAGGAAGSSAAGSGGGGQAGGGGGAEAGSGGGGAGGKKADAGTSMSDCTVTDSAGADKLSAATFCTNFLAYCTGVTGFTPPAGYSDQTTCEASYTASNQQHCRSYHLCWGVEGLSMDGGAANPKVHCQHTVGMGGLCANTDASAGN